MLAYLQLVTWIKNLCEILINFTQSINRMKTIFNLRKFGQRVTDTAIALNTLIINTDLDKSKLSEILAIPHWKSIKIKKINERREMN